MSLHSYKCAYLCLSLDDGVCRMTGISAFLGNPRNIGENTRKQVLKTYVIFSVFCCFTQIFEICGCLDVSICGNCSQTHYKISISKFWNLEISRNFQKCVNIDQKPSFHLYIQMTNGYVQNVRSDI